MEMKWHYRKGDSGRSAELFCDGNLIETLTGIGELIRALYNKLKKEDPLLADLFQRGARHLLTDESPVWQPRNCVTVDMSNLLRYQTGGGDHGETAP